MGCYFNNGLKIETEYYFVHNLINKSCATSVINSALSHFYFHTVLHLRQHGEKKAKVIIGHLLNLAVYLVLRDPVTWSQGAVNINGRGTWPWHRRANAVFVMDSFVKSSITRHSYQFLIEKRK